MRQATAIPKETGEDKKQYIHGLYRKSGQLVNQQLLNVTSLEPCGVRFGSLTASTQKKIQDWGNPTATDQEIIVQGVNLTASEGKLVNAFCRLLQRESKDVYDGNNPGFYTGNLPSLEVDKVQGRAPQLCIPTTELVREYTGNSHPSGAECLQVEDLVNSLCEKRFLLKYTVTDRWEKNTSHERSIETYAALIQKIDTKERVVEEGKEIECNDSTTLLLNPIFRNEIKTNFILLPCDLEQTIKNAYGGKRVPKGVQDLAEWLLREISKDRYVVELGADKLELMVARPSVNGRKFNQAKIQVHTALSIMKTIGLLKIWEQGNNILGECKYTIYLNENFLKAPDQE